MGMYFDGSKTPRQSNTNVANELTFSTVTGTANKASTAASAATIIFCALSVIALLFFGFLGLLLSIGAIVSAASGFPAAKRDGRLGVAGAKSQIAVLTFLLLLGVAIFVLSVVVIGAGY